MTAFTLGEAAATVLGRVRVRQQPRDGITGLGFARRFDRPVRRDSIEAGSFEDAFFAVPAKGACDAMLRAAREALDTGRRLKRAARTDGRVLSGAERAIAGLTAGAVRVFEELCALARLNRGRVYPSYDRLAATTALGRATVARALALLEAAGFLRRQRRYVRVDGEGAGPRYAQTSNAYHLTLPATLSARLARLIPRWRAPLPIPDDAAQHAQDQARELGAMHDQLSCRDLAQATVGGTLGQMLARLGARIDQRIDAQTRESHNWPEPRSQFIGNRTWHEANRAGPLSPYRHRP